MNDWWLGKKVDFALFSEKLRQWGKLCVTGGCDGRNKVHLWVKKSVWYIEENVNVGGWKCKCDIVSFSAETFCDDNQARQRWEQETQDVVYKEGKGNVLEAMILGRKIILVLFLGFGN